ncbi:recombination protein O N-terminal domain-containing protein [Patescibacteria group bacterium]|nr:recombination protein O N-terminal domain-containing protein [Patescibacteria group bacterium]
MAAHYRTEGFVLSRRDSGEANCTCAVFTKDFGKLYLYAIGERKALSKLRQGLATLSLSEVQFVQGKTRTTLVDAVPRELHQVIRSNLLRTREAFRVAHAVDMLLKGQERDEQIWKLLSAVFCSLNDASIPASRAPLVYLQFFWQFVSLLGYRPPVLAQDRETADSYLARLAGLRL